jgi:DNA-directed RNA polymerase II subunit RPB2
LSGSFLKFVRLFLSAEFFGKPDVTTTKNLKPYNYDKLQEDGFIKENTIVEGGDIIIGRCMPQKVAMNIVHKDTSVALKSNNDYGFIDRNCSNDKYFINTNGDGYNFAKVRIRNDRIPTIGEFWEGGLLLAIYFD